MNPSHHFCPLITGLLILMPGAGCDTSPNLPAPPTGKECSIQFRRDSLGAAADLPISPETDSINGATVSLHGTIRSAGGDWICIERKGAEIWIPKANILLIRYP
jgi:hypothetical protein